MGTPASGSGRAKRASTGLVCHIAPQPFCQRDSAGACRVGALASLCPGNCESLGVGRAGGILRPTLLPWRPLSSAVRMALQSGTVPTPADKGRFVQCASLGTVAWSPAVAGSLQPRLDSKGSYGGSYSLIKAPREL